jgi:hypothetical protein
MTGKVVNKSYPVKVIVGEVLALTIVGLVAYSVRDVLPTFEHIDFTADRFTGSANALNAGLIFAMFLAIFMSDTSKNIKDARNHSAFAQPVVIVLVNSFLLCGLSLVSSHERWLNLLFVISAILFLIVNIKKAWEMLALSRDRRK